MLCYKIIQSSKLGKDYPQNLYEQNVSEIPNIGHCYDASLEIRQPPLCFDEVPWEYDIIISGNLIFKWQNMIEVK